MKRLNSHKYNVLLVKDDVGRPKPTTRCLPNRHFDFGKAVPRDAEGAGSGKFGKVLSLFIHHFFAFLM